MFSKEKVSSHCSGVSSFLPLTTTSYGIYRFHEIPGNIGALHVAEGWFDTVMIPRELSTMSRARSVLAVMPSIHLVRSPLMAFSMTPIRVIRQRQSPVP